MSSAKIEKFARMANQIGDYYVTQPADQAGAGVASHIRKFWTPKMIAEMLAALEQQTVRLNATAADGFAILHKQSADVG